MKTYPFSKQNIIFSKTSQLLLSQTVLTMKFEKSEVLVLLKFFLVIVKMTEESNSLQNCVLA